MWNSREQYSNIHRYICVNKTPNYDFLNSKNSRWIQLSDMVSGINGALMAYVNLHDIRSIRERLRYLMKLKIEI